MYECPFPFSLPPGADVDSSQNVNVPQKNWPVCSQKKKKTWGVGFGEEFFSPLTLLGKRSFSPRKEKGPGLMGEVLVGGFVACGRGSRERKEINRH